MHNFIIESLMILFVMSCVTVRVNLICSSSNMPSLYTLQLDGHFNFDQVEHATRDFGNRYYLPVAVLHPESVSDIAALIKHVWDIGPRSELTVAARGHGHSLQGQSQAHRGVIVNMESLKRPIDIHVNFTGNFAYADVSGGELWINILHESLNYGLAPKSWTDYLHLTVGGTLSNAGISGQTFRHGPQISNVHQLQVVTGFVLATPPFASNQATEDRESTNSTVGFFIFALRTGQGLTVVRLSVTISILDVGSSRASIGKERKKRKRKLRRAYGETKGKLRRASEVRLGRELYCTV
ncbi:hypothetical protein ACLB2K_033150 [Fragaria x ananassa]